MKIRNIVMGFGAAAVAVASLVGCAATDVVAKVANTSFAAVVAALGPSAEWSERDQSWVLSSPYGDHLFLSSDFSRDNAGAVDLDLSDAKFIFDASPFIAAGLDVAKLPPADGITYELEDDRLMIHFELCSDKFVPEARTSFEATFSELVKYQRSRIGYHEKLDHYGIKLGNGNMFEWAKDIATNDKDIVFVLNPDPFIAAGVDPAKIEGWLFAKVETKDDAGKIIQVDKLLKAYNIK
jgi:hypothetical protein